MYLHNARACEDYKPRKENTADAEREGRVGNNVEVRSLIYLPRKWMIGEYKVCDNKSGVRVV